MTKVFADAELLAKLQNVTTPLELCNAEGKVIGRVFPAFDLSEYEPWEPVFSKDQLKKAEQSGQWHTTAEVLSHLEKQ